MGGKISKEQKFVTTPRDYETTKQEPTALDVFQDSMKYLVEHNLYSDLTIICHDDRYPVHRAIVCPRSTWFEEKCKEIQYTAYERSKVLPFVIALDHSEDPRVIAALLTYLYTLDYAEEGPQMSFGSPYRERRADWPEELEDTSLPEYSEATEATKPTELEAPLIEREVPDSEDSSEFDFSTKGDEANGYDYGDIKTDKNDGWETMSTARNTPDNATCRCDPEMETAPPPSLQADSDPGKTASPLALHIQVYKTALRYGIPHLASHALSKFKTRISGKSFDDIELLEAASRVYEEGYTYQDCWTKVPGYVEGVQQSILGAMKERWASVKGTKEFEELALRRPGFGRDVMRML